MEDEDLAERSLEVFQIPDNVDDDLLWLYFEGRRSGGGEIISLDRKGDHALIVFQQAEVAARVLAKPSHNLSNTNLLVRKKPPMDDKKYLLRGLSQNINLDVLELYVENLTGLESQNFSLHHGKDLVLVSLHQPPHENFQSMCKKVSRRMLEGAQLTLERVEHTDSVWVENLPPSFNEDLLALYFSSSRSDGGEVVEVSKTTEGCAKITFKDFESVDKVLQKSHILEQHELRVKPFFSFLCEELDACLQNGAQHENQVSDESSSTILSPTSPQQDALPSKPQPAVKPKPATPPQSPTVEIRNTLPAHPPDPEPSTCHVSVPDFSKLELISVTDLPAELMRTHPNLKVRLMQDGVEITGMVRQEMEMLKHKLLEFLSGVSQTHLTISSQKAEFLQRKAVRDRLTRMLKEKGVSCTYTVSDTVLILTSTSLQDVQQACDTLQRCLGESLLQMEPIYESNINSEEWNSFQMSLELCSARVSDDGKSITVVTLTELEEEEKEKLVKFLGTTVQKVEYISMEPAMLSYLQLHHQQLLLDMNEVIIDPLDTGDGLSIQGNAMACRMAKEILTAIISSTETKNLEVKQPGITRFLKEEEGTSILGEMTAKFQVYISLEKVHWEPLKEDIFELAWKMMSSQSFKRSSVVAGTSPKADHAAHLDEAVRILSMERRRYSSQASSPRSLELEEDLYSAPDQLMEVDESGGATNSGNVDEDARLSLAIQLSMEANQNNMLEEDQLQKVLQLSNESMEVEDSSAIEKAVEASMQEAIRSANTTHIKVFAGYPHDLVRVDIALGKKVGQRQHVEKVEHSSLKRLSAFHRRCVDLIKRKHAVEIQIQGTTAMVSGFRDYVAESLPDLNELLKKASDIPPDMEMLKTVQWARHKVGQGVTVYPPEALVILETAWRMKQKRIDIVFDSQPYTIDLEKMVEFSVSSGQSVPVSRRIRSSLDLYTDPQEDYSLLSDLPDVNRLQENSSEYDDVVREFMKSIPNRQFKIIKVEKVNNRLLYSQYQLKKADMESKVQSQVERLLYHGTSESSVKEICIHGFNRSFCGKNATVYGQGVYFAVESSYSVHDNYSPPNADGHKFIFLARVLTGEYTPGGSNMRTAPLKEGSSTPMRFHSVVDRMDGPSIFVIFNDTQAYPQYLITCQKL